MTRRLIAGSLAILLLVSCAGAGTRGSGRVELLVAAASSLTDAFRDIEAAFEEAHPGIDVVLNLGGSSLLREQILARAPVDAFAPANMAIMEEARAAGLVSGSARVFARNTMAIAVPVGNPGGVTGLDDLARPELLVGLCAETVPCGRFTRQILLKAGVTARPDTEEPNVRALLTKVEQGELDTGIVYATDVRGENGVVAIAIPEDYNVTTDYPIAIMSATSHPEAATAFVAYVLSDEGRALLGRHGFQLP
ncbi:molybdate ABC transporter substrate-binding protein [Candidatus Spongiisocius sp.]|uniref:molybdate ABC transporter substrate-binding protein n=1 Tax=Candidatus Spongiisocius sp. TaxID=3101273 RepID=UPI003B5984B1